MDQFYFEEGYLEASYFVYIAEARVDLRPYIEENYIDTQYWEYYGIESSLSGELTQVIEIIVEADAALSSEFALAATVTRVKDAIITVDALFSPSITVNAQLAGVALLETQSTLTSEATITRGINVTLANIANVDAQAAKTAVFDSTMATAFTQTTSAVTPIFFTVSLQSRASLYASKYLGTGRPRNLGSSNFSFETSVKKFGSSSLEGFAESAAYISTAPRGNEDWAVEFYIHRLTGMQIDLSWFQFSSSVVRVRRSNATNIHNITNNSAWYNTGDWNHVLMIKNSSTTSLYINGTRRFTASSSTDSLYQYGQVSYILISNGDDTTYPIDEVSVWRGTTLGYDPTESTITVPTAARSNDFATTQALFHFDGDLNDDVTETLSATATLSASATTTATANPNTKQAAASITATASAQSTATKIVAADSSISSEFAQSATAEITRNLASAMTSAATVATDAYRIKQFAITVDALFTPSITAVAQLAGLASLECQFSQTASAAKTTDIDSAQSAEFAQSTSVDITRNIQASLAGQADVSATVFRIQTADSDLATESTLTAEAYKIQAVAADLTTEATASIQADRIRGLASAISATATATAVVGVIKQFSTFYVGNRTAKTVTAFGNAAISTDQAKFGSGSALITDTGDYFTISGNSTLYNGNFTVELFLWGSNLTQTPNGTIWDNRTSSSNGFYLYVSYGSIGLYEGINGKGLISAGFNNSQWNHIALVRNGNNAKVFVNGVQKISATVTTTNYSNRTTYISSNYLGAVPLRGYYDEVRLSSNARYTTSFTPTAQAFVDDATTQALLHLDSDFSDDIGAFDGIVSSTTLIAETANTIGFEIISTVSTSMTTSAVKTASAQSSAQAAFTQTASAVKTASASIQALTLFSPNINAVSQLAGVALLETQATVSCSATRIFDIGIEPPISGVNFSNDTLIKIRNSQPVSLPTLDGSFLISFWAYSPLGTILDWFPFAVNGATGRLRFEENSLVWENYIGDNSTDRRRVSFTVDSGNWNHYLLYAEEQTPAVPIKLYQNGTLISGTVTTVDDGNTPPSPPSRDQLDTENTWILGANTENWRNFINEVTNGARVITPMQGAITQFVAYWTSPPTATDSAVRSKFYDQGYLDLGETGTETGLSQPDIYLRLNTAQDYQQQGLVADRLVEWREITQTDYDPTWDTINWSLTGLYTPQAANDTSPGFLARATMITGVSGVFLFDLDIDSQFTQATTATRILENPAALSAQATVDLAGGGGLFGAQGQLETTLVLALDISKRTGYAAALTAEATITAQAGFFETFTSAITATATLEASIDVKPPIRAEAALTATATLVVDVASFTDATVLVVSSGTLICDATLIPPIRAEAELHSEFTVSATIGAIEQFAALVASAGTLTASPVKQTGAVITTQAEFAQSTQETKFTGIIETLQVQGFTVTVGDVINLDPALTLVIPPETREFTVLPESRQLTIDSETRLLTILRG